MGRNREELMEKERVKTLSQVLVEECKNPACDFSIVCQLLSDGADLHFSGSKPIYWAAKKLNFELVRLLIDKGALHKAIARTYVASMCDYKGFSDETEAPFFELIDYMRKLTGEDYAYFVPYINSAAVNGRLDKLDALIDRYRLSPAEVCDHIFTGIIFEVIKNDRFDMLEFINENRQWIDKAAFDLAVSSGETVVLEYILENSGFRDPSASAVSMAVFNGYLEILDLLIGYGFDFKGNPLYLEKACRACFSTGTEPIRYLLAHGYRLTDSYKGRTVYAHALKDENGPLLRLLAAEGINQ